MLHIEYHDQCLLWDSKCTGNRSEALQKFFNASGSMKNFVYKSCGFPDNRETLVCLPWRPAPAMSASLISWMREPDCRSSFLKWHTEHPDELRRSFEDTGLSTVVPVTIDWMLMATTTSIVGCCDYCQFQGGNVDVYFWPVADANSECLDTVGTSVQASDQDLFITDSRGFRFWKSQPNPYQNDKSKKPQSLSITSSPPPSLQVRAFSVIRGVGNSSHVGRTTTVGDLTLQVYFCASKSAPLLTLNTSTSPSIYVAFSSITAIDRCGNVGTPVPYTVLAFTPGELSTIEGPVWDRSSIQASRTKSFDFADLPCPPTSVMVRPLNLRDKCPQ